MSTARIIVRPSWRSLRVSWNGDHIMPQGKSASRQLVLVDNPGLGSVRVEMESFFDFSFWLAEELEDLVAKWQTTAAPNATRQSTSANSTERI